MQSTCTFRRAPRHAAMAGISMLLGLATALSATAEPPDTPEHVVGTNPYPFETADPREEERSGIELPESILPRLEQLTEEEIEFLASGDARSFAGNLEKTVEALEERTPEEIQAWVQAMMQVVEGRRYEKGRDSPNISLNTDSPEFNAWRMVRPRSMDPEREAGPIDLGRYDGRGGPPTFGGFPLALTQEDLIAGEVDAAILGAPLNMGSNWRDSGSASTTEMRVLGRAMGGADQYVQVNPGSTLNIVDYGDVAIDNASTERSMQEVRRVVREIAETGAVPLIVGGDHSLSYPNIAGLADVYGKEQLTVIHFDAHYDAWWGSPHLMSHGAPVYRLLNEGHVKISDYIQMGLRSSGPDRAAFKWMRESGMRYHTMAEIEHRGWEAVLDRVVAEASEQGRKLFISFDIDVVDPAYMRATGTPVSGGLSMRESITIIRRLCAESDVVGFDLIELHPALDPTYATTINSAHILKACLTGLAMREEGFTRRHYLSPVSAEHAIDNYYGDQQFYLDASEAEDRRRAEKEDKEEEAEEE